MYVPFCNVLCFRSCVPSSLLSRPPACLPACSNEPTDLPARLSSQVPAKNPGQVAELDARDEREAKDPGGPGSEARGGRAVRVRAPGPGRGERRRSRGGGRGIVSARRRPGEGATSELTTCLSLACVPACLPRLSFPRRFSSLDGGIASKPCVPKTPVTASSFSVSSPRPLESDTRLIEARPCVVHWRPICFAIRQGKKGTEKKCKATSVCPPLVSSLTGLG